MHARMGLHSLWLRTAGRRGGSKAGETRGQGQDVRRSAEPCKHAIAMPMRAAGAGNQQMATSCWQSCRERDAQRPWVPPAPALRRSQCVSVRHHGLMTPLPVNPLSPDGQWLLNPSFLLARRYTVIRSTTRMTRGYKCLISLYSSIYSCRHCKCVCVCLVA